MRRLRLGLRRLALGVTPAPLDAMASAEPDDVQCAVNFNPAGGKAAH